MNLLAQWSCIKLRRDYNGNYACFCYYLLPFLCFVLMRNTPVTIEGTWCTREIVFISWYPRNFNHGCARPLPLLANSMSRISDINWWPWCNRWLIFFRICRFWTTEPAVYCSHTLDHFLWQLAWTLMEMFFKSSEHRNFVWAW